MTGPTDAVANHPTARRAVAGIVFAAGAAFSVTPWATPAIALAMGLAAALTFGNPWQRLTSSSSRRLLQISVVGLGFGIPLRRLVDAGLSDMAWTAVFIALVLSAGLALGRWMRIERHTSLLIAAGTSICGGSAIAAVGPAIGAPAESMSVALATVFVLNAVALYLFPPIGHLLHLSQHQFGVWAALAIHDTSSVVGAAAAYGAVALQEATILKLARALWILPLALGAGLMRGRRTSRSAGGASPRPRAAVPWFIGLFVLAAVARSLVPARDGAVLDHISDWARTSLVLTLFLIGAGLSRAQLRAVGARPLAQGLLLWIAVTATSLTAVWWWVAR